MYTPTYIPYNDRHRGGEHDTRCTASLNSSTNNKGWLGLLGRCDPKVVCSPVLGSLSTVNCINTQIRNRRPRIPLILTSVACGSGYSGCQPFNLCKALVHIGYRAS